MQMTTLGSCPSFLRLILPAIFMLGLGLSLPAHAANTYFVDLLGQDTNSCAGTTTACRTITRVLNLPPGPGDTISIAAGTYSLGETFPLTITKDLFITGAGALSTTLDASGANGRVIFIGPQAGATISGVAITGGTSGPIGPSGSGTGGGGGIRNEGKLTLDKSTVRDNSGGGGIFNSATLTLINSTVVNNKDGPGIFSGGIQARLTLDNSTVSGNDGQNGPGGIYNFFGTLTLNNSTVSGNKAGGVGGIRNSAGTATLNNSTVSGNQATGNITGGIHNDCSGGGSGYGPFTATLILTNSTVSGNTAATYGGGIVNESMKLGACDGAVVTLNNSTVTNNTAMGDGGGIIQDPRNNYPATVNLKNSIVADNKGTPNPNCSGVMTSLGHNLSSDATCLGGPWDLNVPTALLGPLGTNGGPTLTHVLQPGSAAIDAVPLADCKDTNNAPITTDQRGVARPQSTACEIGAVEGSMFEYAVKFVCGRALSTASIAPHPVAPGVYYTAINVHNPTSATISFSKKFARALPNQNAGNVSSFFPATLNADQAFEIECAEIRKKLGLPPLLSGFVTGFAVFQTAQELDIVAVYTAATTLTGPVVTLHTERVPKRP